jgi:hypothetical protein
MKKMLLDIVIAIVAYVMVVICMDTILPERVFGDPVSAIIRLLVPLVVALGAVFIAFKTIK